MDVVEWVTEQGGIVRAAELRRHGASSRAIAAAVARGALQRPRKGWIASPRADPYLVAAARAGVVLTCVTQARRLGLWVLDADKPHVGAPSHAGTVRVEREPEPPDGADARKAVVHWAAPLVPRDPAKLVDPIENVLALVAACRP
ncbi:MAG: type IV toxin-antitoxin system AbiEi family antitoxin domain-containing protein, partial [Microbacterium sp.]